MTRRLGLRLWLLGLVGWASLLLASFELVQPPQMGLSPFAFRALALINPLILLTLLVALGTWLAPRTGLDAPLVRAWIEHSPIRPVLRAQLKPAILTGAVCAGILLVFAVVSAQWFAGTLAAQFKVPLVTRLLYGGVTEELLMRWGLMTLLVWLLLRAGVRGSPACVAAAVVAAALFAAGHLPMLFQLVDSPSPTTVFGVLAANFVPGLLFGLLFWKRGLESAMMAHALAHLFSWAILLLF